MVFNVTVLYPNEPGATFDMEYYLSTHMPLVQKNWGPVGLKSWEITKVDAGLGGSEPAYTVQANLVWDSPDVFKSASNPESEAAKAVFGDIPKFSSVSPILLAGSVVGASDKASY